MKWNKDDALKDTNSNFLAFPYAMLSLYQQDRNWFSTFSCLMFYEHLFKQIWLLQAGSVLYCNAKNATIFPSHVHIVPVLKLLFPKDLLLLLS